MSLESDLSRFFDYIWGRPPIEVPAYVYTPVKGALFVTDSNPVGWRKFMWRWPDQKKAVLRHVLQMNAQGADVYYSPALYSQSRPTKDNVLGSQYLWADFDGNAPAEWPAAGVPEPTLIIQSSLPGHEHCYWRLSEFLFDIEQLEERNRAIAYVLKADTSGWDADQVLRPPGTTNYKRGVQTEVKVWHA